MKLKPEDVWFSKCVRQRTLWTCECCEKQYEEGSQGLHCSHFFSRTKRSTRWFPLNAAAHCMGCHTFLGGNPYNFNTWMQNHIGEVDYLRLVLLSNEIAKFTPKDRRAISLHYKQTFEWMKTQNPQLQIGGKPRIEFPIAPVIEAKLTRLAA